MKQHTNIIPERDASNSISNSEELPSFYLNDEALQELQNFCQSFDPYKELGLEDKLRLQEYGVTDFSNPFTTTNTLLAILENNIQYRESLNDS